ncbi:unnamed protein product [Hydatigera taeniaeformis]|uniref:Alpha-glucosidase n=1 Tax=Hydatigena taeniaeformis TaxID=6205 RepID=A0A0R3WZC9_HYDTA|nr:unnamed protein product [Hydatigera taeniaeformis]
MARPVATSGHCLDYTCGQVISLAPVSKAQFILSASEGTMVVEVSLGGFDAFTPPDHSARDFSVINTRWGCCGEGAASPEWDTLSAWEGSWSLTTRMARAEIVDADDWQDLRPLPYKVGNEIGGGDGGFQLIDRVK